MTFMTTALGDEMDVRYPQAAHVKPFAIAWQLAQINRFNGAARRPYSVAEHSLLVCEIAERQLHLDVHGLLWALCHDAHEAAVGDQISPQKSELGTPWRQHEDRWQRMFVNALGLTTARAMHHEAVRTADLLALSCEREALLPRTPTPWTVLEHHAPMAWAVTDLQDKARTGHDWEFWRDRWLDRWHELQEHLTLHRDTLGHAAP